MYPEANTRVEKLGGGGGNCLVTPCLAGRSIFLLQAHHRVLAVAASYGPDDEGTVRRSAETCAGKFLDVSSAGHVESAKAVAAERPQIFVDLMGHTTGARCVCDVINLMCETLFCIAYQTTPSEKVRSSGRECLFSLVFCGITAAAAADWSFL